MTTSFNVSISAITGTGNSAGFVDSTSIFAYEAKGSNPSTTTDCQNKKRANIRYESMIGLMQYTLGALYVSNVVATGGNASTAPSTFSFDVTMDHADANSLQTVDETSNTVTLRGSAALKRTIARGLIANTKVVNSEIAYATLTTAPQNGSQSNAANRVGSTVEDLTVGQLTNSITTAETRITITAKN